MARARNIKPGFFANEELVELPFATRLLFIGLWTLADREGRLEDKPKRIKMALFPADNLDIDHALSALSDSKFLIRYEHGGDRYIQVTSFSKHQNPHRDEKASTIPEPQEHRESTVQTQCNDDANSVAIGLIPDSLPLIPDSLIPEKTTPQQAASAKAPKFDAIEFFKDHSVNPQVLTDWLKIRKGKRLVSTETAFNGFIAEVQKTGMNVHDAIALCCIRGWGGLDAKWLEPKSKASPALAQNQNLKLGVHGQATANAAQRWLDNSNA